MVDLLRHTLATLAYRGSKTIREVPQNFAEFRATPSTRTPGQILAHIGDLLDWALSITKGEQAWHDSAPQPWSADAERFFAALSVLDNYLAAMEPSRIPAAELFQGPIADALTHVGQIAMLRRMAGHPIKGENYLIAAIAVGRVGPDQSAPRREFD